MIHPLRSAVLGTRISTEAKARFAVLAARQQLTESALLALLVDQVLAANPCPSMSTTGPVSADGSPDLVCSDERITLRLRTGDRALAEQRAAARRMKTSTYLAMLVRAHVRDAPVMPAVELDELRSLAGHLAAMGRQLRMLTQAIDRDNLHAEAREFLSEVGHRVEGVRDQVAAVVRANVISWEAGHG